MSKSASLPVEQFDPLDPSTPESGSLAWKQEVNQRLAERRTRRMAGQDVETQREAESPRASSARAAEAAARVAARYAKAPSYSQLLASEARAVVRAAGAAAEAARDAQAAAEAVLAGLESDPVHQDGWRTAPQATVRQVAAATVQAAPAQPARWLDEPPAQEMPAAWAGAQPRWEEALPVTAPPPAREEPVHDVWAEMRVPALDEPARSYRYQSDEAELFPADAMASATVEPVQHLPANLIEFPRELVAARKARPRLAEGPFYDAAQESPQLSIFEVDPELLAPPIAIGGPAHEPVAPPEWASIELDHHREAVYEEAYAYRQAAEAPTASYHAEAAAYAPAVQFPAVMPAIEEEEAAPAGAVLRETVVRASAQPQAVAPPVELLVASVSDRLMATVVDAALITLAFLAASVVVIAATEHPPTGKIALIVSGCAVAIFTMLYQFLFLSYAEEGTPGMRYARIALCTFDDDNPTREQMRMRIPALLVAAIPAGLGLLWAIWDKDKLGWQDRLTKTYQRKY